MNIKKYLAEFIGTAILVFVGCGSAAFLGTAIGGGYLMVAFAFGLSIIALAYVIGNVSGCHVNPAVSLAVLINKGMNLIDFIGYVIAQFIGALAGAGLLKYLTHIDKLGDVTGTLGSNGFGTIGLVGALIIEMVLTFIFIFTILGVTSDKEKSNVAGLVIGFTLTLVHIVGIHLTGTSVNPARSFAPALLTGGTSLSQVWVFIVAPFVGATLAAIIYKLLIKKPATR